MTTTENISITDWEAVIKENLPNTLVGAKFCLAVLGQLMIKDVQNPFALVIVDVPSSAKTLTLNLFSGLKDLTYHTDKFTPASFVSHSAKASSETLREKIDLLPRIKDKTLIVRDMATVFTDNPERLKENLGVLTRVLDGEGYRTESGVHGSRGYDENYLFMFLAATTPIKNKTWDFMSSLGARIFFFHTRQPDLCEDDLFDQIMAGALPLKKKLCEEATTKLVESIWDKHPDGIEWDSGKNDADLIRLIGRVSILLARSRSIIEEDKNFGISVQSEQPSRINRLLYNFARGNAVINGRDYIILDDVKQAFIIAIESSHPKRAKVIRYLFENGGESNTTAITHLLKVQKPTAISLLKRLERARLLDIDVSNRKSTEPATVTIKAEFFSLTNLLTEG